MGITDPVADSEDEDQTQSMIGQTGGALLEKYIENPSIGRIAGEVTGTFGDIVGKSLDGKYDFRDAAGLRLCPRLSPLTSCPSPTTTGVWLLRH